MNTDTHKPSGHEDERRDVNTLSVENEVLRKGFTLIPNSILRARGLSRDAKLLYGILLSYAWQSDSCFPGYDTLMEDMQCGRPQVAKYIKELKKAGLIEVQRRGQGLTSIYTIKDIRGEEIQKFQNETSRSFKNEQQEVSKRNSNKDSVEKNSVENTSNIRKASTSKNSGNGVPGSEHTPPGLTVSHSTTPDSTVRPVPPPSDNGRTTKGPGDERPYRPATEQLEPLASALTLRGGPVIPHNREVAPPARVPRRRGRPTTEEAEARENLRRFIADFGRELGDQAPRSSLTWAVNCMQKAGMDMGTFTSVLYEARSITQDRTATIHKLADSGDTAWRRKNKFAYFKSVVEDLLGLREGQADPAMPELAVADESPPVRFGQLPPRR